MTEPVAFCAPYRTEYAELVLQAAGLNAPIREHPWLSGDTVLVLPESPALFPAWRGSPFTPGTRRIAP
jgi:hypothetical protein